MKSTFEQLARGGRLLVVRLIHYCFWRLFFRPFFVTGFDGAYFSAQNGFFLSFAGFFSKFHKNKRYYSVIDLISLIR